LHAAAGPRPTAADSSESKCWPRPTAAGSFEPNRRPRPTAIVDPRRLSQHHLDTIRLRSVRMSHWCHQNNFIDFTSRFSLSCRIGQLKVMDSSQRWISRDQRHKSQLSTFIWEQLFDGKISSQRSSGNLSHAHSRICR
jgi:hypothetical protein